MASVGFGEDGPKRVDPTPVLPRSAVPVARHPGNLPSNRPTVTFTAPPSRPDPHPRGEKPGAAPRLLRFRGVFRASGFPIDRRAFGFRARDSAHVFFAKSWGWGQGGACLRGDPIPPPRRECRSDAQREGCLSSSFRLALAIRRDRLSADRRQSRASDIANRSFPRGVPAWLAAGAASPGRVPSCYLVDGEDRPAGPFHPLDDFPLHLERAHEPVEVGDDEGVRLAGFDELDRTAQPRPTF